VLFHTSEFARISSLVQQLLKFLLVTNTERMFGANLKNLIFLANLKNLISSTHYLPCVHFCIRSGYLQAKMNCPATLEEEVTSAIRAFKAQLESSTQ